MYTTETYATYIAIKISTNSMPDTSITISDPLSALTAISNPNPKNELVQHIQEMLKLTKNKYRLCGFLHMLGSLVMKKQT